MKNLKYNNYSVLVRHVGFVEVRAISWQAALADIEEAYYQPDIITWSQH